MESKKINQLATNVAPQTSDLTIIGDPITGVSKKITLLQIANLFATTGTVTSVAVTETGNALTITGSPITSAGTINIGFAGAATQYVRGDGALADFPTSTGGGSSVSYYLNSSVSQGTIGGNAYRQLSKTPIIGAGTDITISANGYVANYITDANDPALLEVPGGNFNCEFYFSVNSNNHNPFVYAELYKYDGTTFTLLGSNQAIPDYLSNGTTLSAYYFAIPVATAALTITDRLAIRIYVNVDGRVVTLHTENGHLCQVVTTFSKGLTSLNNLTRQVQFLATGTSGTDFNISSSTATHTFNLPVASATNTGKLSSTDWSTFNAKQPAGNYVTLDTTQTITAAKTFSGVNTFSQNLVINGTGTNSAYTILQSDGTNKWRIGNNYASGVNTFDIFAYDNSSTPLSINSNGAMTLSANVTTTGAQFVQNGFYLSNANAGARAFYTLMWGSDNGINFALRNGTGGASFIFQSATGYDYTFPAATGTLALTSNLSAYLPLTGGTLTGALSGTSAVFSSTIRSNATNGFAVGSISGYRRIEYGSSAATSFALLTDADGFAGLYAGAAIFSSSITATSATFSGNVFVSDNSIFGLRPSTNEYSIQYRDLDFRLIGSSDSGTQRLFSFGYYTSNNIAGTWNSKATINSYTGAATFSSSVTADRVLTAINQNNSTLVAGSIELQSYSVNNSWVGENIYFNGSGFVARNTGYTSQIYFEGDGDMAFKTSPSTISAGSSASPLTRMVITSGGNVGIGTSSPTDFGSTYTTLCIDNATSGGVLDLRRNGVRGLTIAVDGSEPRIEARVSGQPLVFYTNNAGTVAERIRIISTGQLKITQAGNGFVADGLGFINTSGNAWNLVAGGDNNFYIGYNFSAVGYFSSSTGAYVPLSDTNKKKDFEQSTIGLNAIMGLKPTLYRMKTDNTEGNKELGFIAQEVKEFIPQAYVESEKFIGLNYNAIVAALVKSVQELKAEIDILKNK
jgi:hypothetical protein